MRAGRLCVQNAKLGQNAKDTGVPNEPARKAGPRERSEHQHRRPAQPDNDRVFEEEVRNQGRSDDR